MHKLTGLKEEGSQNVGSWFFFSKKTKFKESVLTIKLTSIRYEKSMLYGRKTRGKLSKSLGKLELVVQLRWFDDKVFQKLVPNRAFLVDFT